MKCSEISELWSSYIDAEISLVEKRLVEEHIACCPACAEEMRHWQHMKGLLSELGSIEITVPTELRKNVMAQVEAANRSRVLKGKIAAWFSLSRYKSLVAVAASVLVFGFGYWGFSGGHGKVIEQPSQIARQDVGLNNTRERNSSSVELSQAKDPGSKQVKLEHVGEQMPVKVSEPKNSREINNSGKLSEVNPVSPAKPVIESAVMSTPEQPKTLPSNDNQVMMFSLEKKSLKASMQLSVAEQKAAVAAIKDLSEQYQGEEYRQNPIEQAVFIQFRISHKDFPSIIADIEKHGEVKDKKVEEIDLTAQHKQVTSKLQELQEQKQAFEKGAGNDSTAVKKLNAQIEALRVELAQLDQQAEKAFIAIWIE